MFIIFGAICLYGLIGNALHFMDARTGTNLVKYLILCLIEFIGTSIWVVCIINNNWPWKWGE